MMKVKPVKLGKTERMSFSHIDEVISTNQRSHSLRRGSWRS